MQFIAECRIENGLLSVTLKILNLPNCLYAKKSCEFFQSYEKTSEMQKESSLFFSFTLLRFANSDRWFRVLSKFGNACPNAYPVTFYKNSDGMY